jgi:hypothetical protein
MTTKHTKTTRRPTRKNKRMMSGGRGKISNYTQRFKNHYKRFITIDDNNDDGKLKKVEIWGGMEGIYKFVKAQSQTYKVVKPNKDGVDVTTQVSGLDKMIGNIQNTSDLTNKEEYIKAIDCFNKGYDTILSDGVCVSYSDFVNGGSTSAAETIKGDNTDASPSAPIVKEDTSDISKGTSEGDEAATKEGKAEEETSEDETFAGNNVEGDDAAPSVPSAEEETSEDETLAGNNVEGDDAAPSVPSAEEETSAAPSVPSAEEATSDNDAAEGDAVEGASDVTAESEENASKSQQPTASATAAVVPTTSEQGGGRPRRRARPSRRIKSRKSKKGRMTRRKHRAVRR